MAGYNGAWTGQQIDEAVRQVTNKDLPADGVKFEDGQTFQQKYDAGQLTGPAGQDGAAGADGRGVTSIAYTSSGNMWLFTFSDGVSQQVSGPAIPAVSTSLNSTSPYTAASSSAVRMAYNLAATAMQRSGGTFTGTIKAGSSYQSYSTSLLRNSKLVSSDTTPSVNGEINWTYG